MSTEVLVLVGYIASLYDVWATVEKDELVFAANTERKAAITFKEMEDSNDLENDLVKLIQSIL